MATAPPRKSDMAFVDGAADTTEVGITEAAAAAAPPSTFAGKVQHYCAYAVDGTRRRLAMVCPWKEFFDRQSFSLPSGLSDFFSRLNRNINHYYHNYIIMALLCSSYVLLLNPAFALCFLLTVMMCWFVSAKRAEAAETNSSHFTVASHKITFPRAYLFITLFAGLSFFLTDGSSVVFWLALSSVGVVVVHAAMRKPSVEEQPFSFV
ncbi:RAB-interacting protein [Trypanosoma rangeli]|uniref:PRA1 family protein n=1 Tax=Trypanosoma rangeli TaxID=5698 RepID=A0A3R7ML24_TRYRA|nr:RAB-interacting protein [Trypanosoma rangeli]RNF04442.1 RAB-interacting protein [Trypanosoma rangeli]|eukprot:RNF04442.1 RAB-interacting protein [Trypanosoma rangeli]